MKALILAAGDNTRFRKENDKHNKLLYPVLGIPLIERTIRSAKIAGINEFIIVTGYQDSQIKKMLGNGKQLVVQIDYIHNKSWRGENGTSVYAAKSKINEPFILLMGDHLFEPHVLVRLARASISEKECILAVDTHFDDFTKVEESTKTIIRQGRIVAIGKELTQYNGLDTGMFLCSPYLFSVLEKAIGEGKLFLTDGMRVLAKDGKLKAFNIKDSFWLDIDTHQDLAVAEMQLFEKLVKPNKEGPISKHINRRFSRIITTFLLQTSISPNQVSIISFLTILFASYLFIQNTSVLIFIGGILTQLASILDGVDGEIARVKLSTSRFGAWFDMILDRYGDIAVVAAASSTIYSTHGPSIALPVAVLALTGSILSSYSSHTLQETFGRSLKKGKKFIFPLPAGRDVRLFILFLGGVTNFLFFSLILIAILTHQSVLYRLFLASKVEENA